MGNLLRMISAIVLGGSLVLGVACSGDDGGGSTTTTGGSSEDTTSGGPSCEAKCSSPDECENIPCSCVDGTVVNSTACNNGCCGKEADVCPGSCEDHEGWDN